MLVSSPITCAPGMISRVVSICLAGNLATYGSIHVTLPPGLASLPMRRRSGKRQRRRKKTCGQDAGQCCQNQNAQRALPSLLSGYERCRQPKRAANHTGCKHGAAHSEAEHQRKRSHHSRNPMQSVVSSNQLAEIVDSTMDELTPAHSRKSPYRSGPSKSLPSKYAERSLFWHDTNFLRT